jgi:hypothetical protein
MARLGYCASTLTFVLLAPALSTPVGFTSRARGERRSTSEEKQHKRIRNRTRHGCKFCGLVCSTIITLGIAIQYPELSIRLSQYRPPVIGCVIGDELEWRESVIFGAIPGTLAWNIIPCFSLLPSTLASKEFFEFIKLQLDRCISQHSGCWIMKTTSAPTRLLHIQAEDSPIRLVESDP